MKIEIPVKSVLVIASEAGLPESVIERYFDSLSEIILRAKKQERKYCINNLRTWWHTRARDRPPMHSMIDALEE
jgi:hypothetical protein